MPEGTGISGLTKRRFPQINMINADRIRIYLVNLILLMRTDLRLFQADCVQLTDCYDSISTISNLSEKIRYTVLLLYQR